jgi:hypothetical protein
MNAAGQTRLTWLGARQRSSSGCYQTSNGSGGRCQIVITVQLNTNAGRGVPSGVQKDLSSREGQSLKDAISWASSSLSR